MEFRPLAPLKSRNYHICPHTTIAAIFAFVVLSTVGSYRYLTGPTATASGDRRTIAVLPLDNSTGDPDQDYLVDGITENIINNLSELSSLRVIPRESVFHYKGTEIQPADVARQLHADLLMRGDIKQVGNELIINVNLIDPKDGSHLWGKQFVQNALNIVATPNEITTAVVQRLDLKLTPAESRRLSVLPTENSEAYQLYLKGQSYGQLQSPDGLQKSIELYRQAIEKDPNFALAYSEIGMRYVTSESTTCLRMTPWRKPANQPRKLC
jgi:TolB-like protein